MSAAVFAAVLFAALLHASWNAIIKFGKNKVQAMMLLSLGHGLVGLAMVAAYPLPKPESWWLMAGSVACHMLYKLALTGAYERGDLSRVYPIARGTAPVLVLALSGLVLADRLETLEVLGILGVGLGILLLARGVFVHGEQVQLLPFALASAVGTAGYSIFDGLGARAAGSASSYVGWLFLIDAAVFMIYGFARFGGASVPPVGRGWALGLIAGGASVAAYWIAVWAMTVAPIALVTALRETSVLFAVLIGIVFFRERADMGKLIAALVIVSGVIVMRL